MSRLLTGAAWLALVVAVWAYDTEPRQEPPGWYQELCAEVRC